MIVGDPKNFAIEFEITEAYQSEHFLALGFFIVHVSGLEYGIRAPDATTFGNAIDAANILLQTQGKVPSSRLGDVPAYNLADQYLSAFYREPLGIFPENAPDERRKEFLSANCIWPNQDEEFDDGSHILRFAIGNQIRIVAFRNDEYFRENLAEAFIEASQFYDVVSGWVALFQAQRRQALQRS